MRRIILEFIGGSWDGKNLCNESPDPAEVRLAVHEYLITDNGTVGKEITMPLDYVAGYVKELDRETISQRSYSGHKYRITDRTMIGDEVLVRFEFQQGAELICPMHGGDP